MFTSLVLEQALSPQSDSAKPLLAAARAFERAPMPHFT
jgi:hypothetical protein